MIRLRKGTSSTAFVLANGFDILNGVQEITVPAVTPGDDYSIVLFGDSGNFSPAFAIVV
ncbi:hypothetical protein HGRIS_005288 [Hohenbuehelia grisea]|uniref:Uncharacterized protein n=1 Tax=Hohenbuehelia grisea TaxID=104357 RepID=A0ABR3JEJ8_9AGAR